MLKDYTGEQVTAENLYAVILGDKNSVKGGSGKVVDSKPGDRIFIYYSDHGGPGVLGELINRISNYFSEQSFYYTLHGLQAYLASHHFPTRFPL